MFKLTGLYESKDKNGNIILTSRIGHLKILIFKNLYKKNEKEPDYQIFIDNLNIAPKGKKQNVEQIEQPPFPTLEDAPPNELDQNASFDEIPF